MAVTESMARGQELAARLQTAMARNASLESRNQLLEKFMGLHVQDQGVKHSGVPQTRNQSPVTCR